MGVSEEPVFSAVIPAYNREHTIARAIESALAQSHPPCEVIVVDDGSVDRTADVVKAFDAPVRYVFQENAGAPAARNRGAREARAEWMALLDSDDFWTPDHLARIADAIRATDGRADLYFADTRRTEQEDFVSQWARTDFSIDGAFEFRENATEWVLKAHIPMMLQSSVFHRARFFESGGLWERLPMGDDTHMFYKTCIGGPVCAVANVGAHMTSDDASGGRLTTTQSNAVRRYWEYNVLMWIDLLNRFPELAPRHRAFLRERLAVAYRRLAGFDLASRRLLPGLRQLMRSAALDPGALFRLALGGVGGRDRSAKG